MMRPMTPPVTRRGSRPRRGGFSRECGSASIWVLAFGLLVLVVGYAAVLREAAVLGRHRAEAAADLAALAGAGRIGVGLDYCAVAGRIAVANGAVLTGCQLVLAPDGRSGTVEVRVRVAIGLAGATGLPGLADMGVLASARAGRVPLS